MKLKRRSKAGNDAEHRKTNHYLMHEILVVTSSFVDAFDDGADLFNGQPQIPRISTVDGRTLLQLLHAQLP